jgi:hypothetical protein
MANLFCCKKQKFPLKYLGVPLHFSMLRREDIQHVVDKVIRRVASWKGRFLSYRGETCYVKIMSAKHSNLFDVHH